MSSEQAKQEAEEETKLPESDHDEQEDAKEQAEPGTEEPKKLVRSFTPLSYHQSSLDRCSKEADAKACSKGQSC